MACEKCIEILVNIHSGDADYATTLLREDPSHFLHDYKGSPLELQICY